VQRGDMCEKCLEGTATAVDIYASVFTLYSKLPNLMTHFFCCTKLQIPQ